MMQNMYKKEYSEMLQTFYGIHVSKIETLVAKICNLVENA